MVPAHGPMVLAHGPWAHGPGPWAHGPPYGPKYAKQIKNLKILKVVRMSHPIAKNDGMPRGILLQMSFSPNMPYRAKTSKKTYNFKRKHQKNHKNPILGPLLLSAHVGWVYGI